MQILKPDPMARYNNIAHAFYTIVKHEGPMRTFRGINATIYGAGPAHALYFAAYENLKKHLNEITNHNHLAPGVAGIGATLLHDMIMTPAEGGCFFGRWFNLVVADKIFCHAEVRVVARSIARQNIP